MVTVFLNPLQFAPSEDLSRYPMTLDADVALCAEEDVDLVFAPSVEEVYPAGEPQVRVHAGPLGDVLEGASRPGHFDGVLTVVAKLLHLTSPDVAYFGQKDAQQLLLICADGATTSTSRSRSCRCRPCATADGLALSSRNGYLTDADHGVALTAVPRRCGRGRSARPTAPTPYAGRPRAVLDAEPGVRLDYLALVETTGLTEVPDGTTGPALLAVAARVGTTRLIDNAPVDLGGR